MFGNMGKMMKLAGEMKTKLPEMKEKLAASEYESVVGGGMVKVVVNGKMQIQKITISPDLLDADNFSIEMLEDMIKAAISGAQAQAAKAAEEAMNELTGGMDLPGLSDMF